jgi:hypothetical protein
MFVIKIKERLEKERKMLKREERGNGGKKHV